MFNRFFKNRRGVSTIIGAVFFVLIFIGGFSLISWEIMQYDTYTQAVNDRNRLEWEKQNEIIKIVGVDVAESLNISITNEGAIAAHLADLWITESNETANWHKLFPIDYYVNPGDTIMIIGADIDMPELDPRLTYYVKIVTERGNIAVGTYPESTLEPTSPLVKAFGIFSLDWFYFKYTSTSYPERKEAGSISKAEDYIAFYIRVTNNYNETMTLQSTSMLMLLIDWQEPLFYLVESVSYDPIRITHYSNDEPITVGPYESVQLTFAAAFPSETSWEWGNSQWPFRRGGLPVGIWNGDTPEGAIVMTALVFIMESKPEQIYAQSLPFQALVLSE